MDEAPATTEAPAIDEAPATTTTTTTATTTTTTAGLSFNQAVGLELGCWKDHANTGVRDLPVGLGVFDASSHSNCIKMCQKMGIPFAGIQAGNHCFCGSRYQTLGTSTECVNKCQDNAMCGGGWLNSVYTTYKFEYLGCWNDEKDRAMKGYTVINGGKSAHECIGKCAELGFLYAAVQHKTNCFCDNSYDKYGRAASDTECDMPCTDGTYCGGGYRNSVFTTGLTASDKRHTGWSVTPVDQYMGCFKDAADRAMTGGQHRLSGSSNRECIKICEDQGWPWAGGQHKNECFCGYNYGKCSEGGNGR
eukprot:GHVU01093475.1.p1 GENE.GHVU01093475.1~~GHVU01093475.1.p1  ORF type:complete len:328 (+),score=37.05 GHVU01093475.1:70-984(+)